MRKSELRLRAVLGLAALAAFTLVAGCGENRSDPVIPPVSPAEQTLNLSAPNGGFNTASEEPGFGDAALTESVQEEAAIEDAIESDPEVQAWMQRPGARLYVMSAVWGMLQDLATPGGPAVDGRDREWSGALEVQQGAVLLRSVVSFERADGDSLLSRTSRRRLEWKSFTGEGYDGLRLLLVHIPPNGVGPDRAEEARDSLYFSAGTYSRVLTWKELEAFDEELQLDAIGNRISLQVHRVEATSAHLGGFLRGRWDPIAEGDSVGHFQGVWVGARGRAAGLFHGIYGTREGGEQVFFGKYINADGAFLGILRGTWSTAGREPRSDAMRVELGGFRGEWVNAEGARQGDLSGHFRSPQDRPGFLRGRWCQGDCLTQP